MDVKGKRHTTVVCCILGNSPASEFYIPTFPSYLSAYEDGTDRVFRNVRRKHTTFRTRRKFENKNTQLCLLLYHRLGAHERF